MRENLDKRSFNHSASEQVVSRAMSLEVFVESLFVCRIFRTQQHYQIWIHVQ